jgi:hypothetical protein
MKPQKKASIELDEANLGFKLLKGRNCCSDIFLFNFISANYIINSLFVCFLGSLASSFASLIQIITYSR